MELDRLNQKICKLLYYLKLTPNYKGFYQMAYAVQLTVRDPQDLLGVTKRLYPEIAKYCGTTSGAVERNIRTAINVIWRKSSGELEELAQYSLKEKPSASQVISILVSELLKGNG